MLNTLHFCSEQISFCILLVLQLITIQIEHRHIVYNLSEIFRFVLIPITLISSEVYYLPKFIVNINSHPRRELKLNCAKFIISLLPRLDSCQIISENNSRWQLILTISFNIPSLLYLNLKAVIYQLYKSYPFLINQKRRICTT